jgi:hypothetical protein
MKQPKRAQDPSKSIDHQKLGTRKNRQKLSKIKQSYFTNNNSYLHYKLRKFTFMCEVFLNGRGEAYA